MVYAELVQPLIERRDLTPDQASGLMEFLIGGEATDSQIGGILLGLRIKGCTTKELAAFASVMRAKATLVSHTFPDLVDTCGTGGGRHTFNISTAAAILAAASGVKIAKHGNRSMTGQGSADVLEKLGVPIGTDPERLIHALETAGIAFLYAPHHHPAMKHVAKSRKELGLRTVFNQLGPLSNPAGANIQLIGVYDPGLMRSMGEALRELGSEKAMLVHGLEGLDELSPCGPTETVRVEHGRVWTETIAPAKFELETISERALEPGKDLDEAADIVRESLSDLDSCRSAAIIPSAAAAIYLAGLEPDLPSAAVRARAAVSSGAAIEKLDQIIQISA